jgi:Domain of unknown function (DUF4384)
LKQGKKATLISLSKVVRRLTLLSFLMASASTVAYAQSAEGLDQTVRSFLEKYMPAKHCSADKRISLGLWTLADDKSPIGAAADKRVYQELLSRILKFRPKCADIIDNAGISAIAEHLQKSGALDENGGNVLAALSTAHQNVDMILFPDIYAQSGKIMMTLRLAERASAKTIALTEPVQLPKDYTADTLSDAALSLDAAIKGAADQLVLAAPELREIQSGGIFFEGTEAQPPAGRYIRDHVLSALVERGSNVITNKTIKVRGITIEPANPDQVKASELDSTAAAHSDNAYELKGRYWLRDQAIDLSLSLSKPDGTTASWSGRIRLADLSGVELKPVNPVVLQAPLPKAGYVFQVTSPKGASPTYKAGDELQLMLNVGKPAWVYCFYIDSKGGVVPIYPLPPRFFEGRTNKMEAGKLIKIPDPARDKFRFTFNAESVGEEMVSCFSTLRDVKADLPSNLFPDQLSPIAFLTLEKVRQTFSALKEAQVAESVVTVTVTQ